MATKKPTQQQIKDAEKAVPTFSYGDLKHFLKTTKTLSAIYMRNGKGQHTEMSDYQGKDLEVAKWLKKNYYVCNRFYICLHFNRYSSLLTLDALEARMEFSSNKENKGATQEEIKKFREEKEKELEEEDERKVKKVDYQNKIGEFIMDKALNCKDTDEKKYYLNLLRDFSDIKNGVANFNEYSQVSGVYFNNTKFLTATELGRRIGISAVKVNKFCEAKGWIKRDEELSCWRPVEGNEEFIKFCVVYDKGQLFFTSLFHPKFEKAMMDKITDIFDKEIYN